MWASRAFKMGYKWHVGNGRSINFLGGYLVWELPFSYSILRYLFCSNQQTQTPSSVVGMGMRLEVTLGELLLI
jgi:hypothetical protein